MLALTKNNEIIHIDNALSKVDYYCANCGGRLRVRNGKIKIKHFYHLNSDCGDRGESLIHNCWKKYFLKQKEFDGYNIIEAREEVQLLKGKYIPDIVYKTDKGTYIILEICYKNPKTEEYSEKFKKLKKLEKVYEIIVDFGKILETKVIFDREIYRELLEQLNLIKEEFIKYSKIGGVKYDFDFIHGWCKYLNLNSIKEEMEYRAGYNLDKLKKYEYAYKNSIILNKVKIYLEKNIYKLHLKEKTESFYVNFYNTRELKRICNIYENGYLGEIYIKIPQYEDKIVATIYIDDERYNNIKNYKKDY